MDSSDRICCHKSTKTKTAVWDTTLTLCFSACSGKPRLRQHLAQHAARVCGPRTCISSESCETLYALGRHLSTHVSHPVCAAPAQQWLPSKCSGPAGPRACNIHAQCPAQSGRILLCPRCGLFSQCGDGDWIPHGIHQRSDAQAAALASAQTQGDVTALAARGLAPVAEDNGRTVSIKRRGETAPQGSSLCPEASPQRLLHTNNSHRVALLLNGEQQNLIPPSHNIQSFFPGV